MGVIGIVTVGVRRQCGCGILFPDSYDAKNVSFFSLAFIFPFMLTSNRYRICE